GITKSLTFPATVKKDGNVVVAVAKGVKVNRAQYDVRYGSKTFFADIADKAIDDEFELAFNLVARK
ncbi:MAG TPA: YceI family protein, partial [Sphingobacteriaceae bacterium]